MLMDSDVMVDIMRNHPPALAWVAGLGTTPLNLPGLVAMELLQGCRNLISQQRLVSRLQGVALHWPTPTDCMRAYHDFATYRLSHGLGLLDALIGQTAVGLGETLATFNVKHFAMIPGLRTIQPY